MPSDQTGPSTSEYGESWRVDSGGDIRTAKGSVVVLCDTEDGCMLPADRDRAVACVNALAGIPDDQLPKNLKGMLEFLRQVTESVGGFTEAYACRKLAAEALAIGRGET